MNDEATPDARIVVRSFADRLADAAESHVSSAAEGGYRRGYSHGYSQAIDDFLRLTTKMGYVRPREAWNILASHFDEALAPWRFRRIGYLPPGLDQKSWWEIRLAVFARDGRVCAFCDATDDLQIDHIVPVRSGGLPEIDNLRVLCRSCNNARNGEA